MSLHGPVADIQLHADRFICIALGGKTQYIQFTVGQWLDDPVLLFLEEIRH
jgi:hypothetical protein